MLLLVGLAVFLLALLWLVVFRKKTDSVSRDDDSPIDTATQDRPDTLVEAPPVSFFDALSRSRTQFTQSLRGLFSGGLDDEVREDLEAVLLAADVGVETTDWILDTLVTRAKTQGVSEPDALLALLKTILSEILEPTESTVEIDSSAPHVMLIVGVNGVGKTTTLGKLAYQFQSTGQSVLLAAGDTFRAAAVEQLKTWGERLNVPVIAQDSGADSASVLYDACESAKARGISVVLADTAGRLQNKHNLMSELEKIGRVLGKLEMGAPHEVLLVLDAGTGQNAISQAREFSKAVQPTGLVLTKLDGTAKGGIVFALAREFHLPIRYVGLGERPGDLKAFDRHAFIDALFGNASE
jgi:fused signal recognition particle receptor